MEIVEKVKTAIGLAEEDLDLHVKNLKEGADRFFRIVDGMIKDYYNVKRPWINGIHTCL